MTCKPSRPAARLLNRRALDGWYQTPRRPANSHNETHTNEYMHNVTNKENRIVAMLATKHIPSLAMDSAPCIVEGVNCNRSVMRRTL